MARLPVVKVYVFILSPLTLGRRYKASASGLPFPVGSFTLLLFISTLIILFTSILLLARFFILIVLFIIFLTFLILIMILGGLYSVY